MYAIHYHVAGYYGLGTCLMLALVWASGDMVLQKLGLCLLVSWVATQAADAGFGILGTPLFMPTVQGFLCGVVALLGHKYRSRVAFWIFALYGGELAVHLTAWITGRIETFAYRSTLNVLFAMQGIILGGAGVKSCVRVGVLGSGEWGRSLPARRH